MDDSEISENVFGDCSSRNITREELELSLTENQRSLAELKAENAMYERYIKKMDIKSDSNEGLKQADSNARGPGSRKKSKSSIIERLLKLTAEQKCNIAQIELEDFKQDICRLQEESEKVLDTYRAIGEEAEIRLHEIKKFQYEFDRDVVRGAWCERMNAFISEKLVRHFDEKLRERDTLVDKIRLRNCTLRAQRKKLRMQLRQKEEMGEVLHEVDFDQLKIENNQYLQRIEEKNQELLRLKLMAGKTLVVLNSYKRKLNQLMIDLNRSKDEINQRNELIRRINSEAVIVDKEREKEEEKNVRIRSNLSDYKVPAVMDYVNCVADKNLLKRQRAIFVRKQNISEMALDRHKKLWAEARRNLQSDPV